ncbi:glycerol-3-phosphate 1-O-acyltransferase PlsY [Vreelandella malpeensis]|uniref:Glycerol-3-phosphate acyltransferase n=1 Tax=Vreelandella malpeensis TaxID=1172368 RepID=A0ABS8DRE3_9GAMM|nr:glycerol-3-phosphate 1-O-acyltransferase PlsY [Halomonas malpeensis]MCB8888841.1 glycerol-3-phosphate 1-O-acyltransferase PlsY [Halomonas malpeensis]
MQALGWMLLGYLSGSCLAAPWVCRLAGVADPRGSGSCNPGVSNVLRLYGPRLALATLALDVAKAMPAVAAAKSQGLPIWVQGAVGLAVLLGHSYPLWHGFRGGKAVASAFGVLLVLVPWVALSSSLLWALCAWRLRTAAAASLISAVAAPLITLWLAADYVLVVSAFTLLVGLRHALNIRRLRRGEEPGLSDR